MSTAAVRIRLLNVPFERDEGAYAYMGQLMLAGIPPYAQCYDVKMPGLFAASNPKSSADSEKKGSILCPELEHGAYPMYYTISFRNEDTHFAECILNDTDPEFTPEEAREAVAVSHLAYLAAKKGSVATMAELKDLVATQGTGALFEGLEEMPLKNYEGLRW